MPFGVTWGQYLGIWGIAIGGFACGSQLVHSFYKPLENMQELIDIEVARLREERKLIKLSKEEKLLKILEQDAEYMRKFNVK